MHAAGVSQGSKGQHPGLHPEGSSQGDAGGGDAMSSEMVRHRIKTLIDQEKTDQVLSDDQLVDLLKAEGIDVARRTIAKYRESLGIQSSVQRRRSKALRF